MRENVFRNARNFWECIYKIFREFFLNANEGLKWMYKIG